MSWIFPSSLLMQDSFFTCSIPETQTCTSKRVAVPLLGSTAPNVHASRWLPMTTYLHHSRDSQKCSKQVYKLEKFGSFFIQCWKQITGIRINSNTVHNLNLSTTQHLSGSCDPVIVPKTLRMDVTV